MRDSTSEVVSDAIIDCERGYVGDQHRLSFMEWCVCALVVGKGRVGTSAERVCDSLSSLLTGHEVLVVWMYQTHEVDEVTVFSRTPANKGVTS